MPVENGVGRSDNTPLKQQHLRDILRLHIAIVKAIQVKHSYADRRYRYWDLTAGPGHYEGADFVGSPLVFLQEARAAGVPYLAHLFESRKETAEELAGCVSGDSSVFLHPSPYQDELLQTVERGSRSQYGMIYADPNGAIPDLQSIAALLSTNECRCVDVLLQIAANDAYKRPRCAWPDKESLRAVMQTIGKDGWLIRAKQPGDKAQWTFLLGTWWRGMPQWKKQGFHWVDSPEGKAILDELDYTRAERRSLREGPALFHIPGVSPSPDVPGGAGDGDEPSRGNLREVPEETGDGAPSPAVSAVGHV